MAGIWLISNLKSLISRKMALKTFVKISSVNNLSDARYCAGMGVDIIGFDLHEGSDHYVSPSKFKEIERWISGVKLAGYAYCHAMPMVMVMSYRGDLGESNWWGHNHAQTMEPILDALRIPWRTVRKIEDIKSSIDKAIKHAESSQWPVALVMSGDCVEIPGYGKD